LSRFTRWWKSRPSLGSGLPACYNGDVVTGRKATTRRRDARTRAEGFVTNLRAFFCLCLLLPLYLAPEHETLRASAAGMDAPPPPTLESSSRFGVFGGLERRLLGGPSVASSLWILERAWFFTLPQPAQPDVAPTSRSQLQQWRLEGG